MSSGRAFHKVSLISEMPLVTSSSDNHGLSQFVISLFRISNQ